MSRRTKMGFVTEIAHAAVQNANSRLPVRSSECVLVANTGLPGTPLFSSREDYDRFEAYLYILNATESERASNYFLPGRERSIFEASRGDQLVAIASYSFTPKAFYILVRPLAPRGIARFMQKLQTAYTMYFNIKYQRSGRLFHARYHSITAQSDKHLKFLFAFVQLYPFSLFNSEWPTVSRIPTHEECRRTFEYRYSGVGEYAEKKYRILTPNLFPAFVHKGSHPQHVIKMWREGLKTVRHDERGLFHGGFSIPTY